MAITTLAFLVLFAAACGGAMLRPMIGIVAYMLVYQVGPENQWWTEPIAHWGIRYSFVLAAFTAAGIVINRRKLRCGRPFLVPHEYLLVAFVCVTWLSVLLGRPPEGEIVSADWPPLKLTKILIFALMLTHVSATLSDLNWVLWAYVIGGLFLGYQALTAPAWMMTEGRLDAIGGPDFRQANGLAVYLLAALPIIGVQFMRSRWPGRLLCLASGAMAVNAIVMTRSRGAVMGAAGVLVVALVIAPKGLRKAAFAGVILAAIGAYALTDAAFWERASTTTASDEERDGSAQSRIEIWKGSLAMLQDYWYGVGAGNFQAAIGQYCPRHPKRDAHNTYVRCYSELGIQGMAVFTALILSAACMLRRVYRDSLELTEPYRKHVSWLSYALFLSLCGYLLCGLTGTLLYVEALYWLLALPVCLWRSARNLAADKAD
ncbi:MAG: O-antigen ligase family protein [Chloroflexi bacterium]|nr:O-antigen ligase family protein [Chloroflexota bacterium]